MTRNEAEEAFISAIISGSTCVVEMSLKECQVFRVLVGRCIKEMEAKNRPLWLKAREFGIEYKEPYAVIKRIGTDRMKIYKVDAKGNLTNLHDEESTNEAENRGSNGEDEAKDSNS